MERHSPPPEHDATSLAARGAILVLAASAAALVACGPNPRRVAAEDTVRTASSALAEVHSSGGESPALAPALAEADEWLAHAEEAVDLWHAGAERSLPYETAAPCLARALGELREALTAAGTSVPATLETAEAAAAGATEATCPSRRRPSAEP